jgi:hypothetical protein
MARNTINPMRMGSKDSLVKDKDGKYVFPLLKDPADYEPCGCNLPKYGVVVFVSVCHCVIKRSQASSVFFLPVLCFFSICKFSR